MDAAAPYVNDIKLPTEAVDGVYTVTANVVEGIAVTWQNDDGSALGTDYVLSGATPSHDAPTKAISGGNRYEFAGWLKNGAGDPITDLSSETVTEAVTYKATFNAIALTDQYNITFDLANGTEPVTVKVFEGVNPTFDGVPEKADSEDGVHYTFAYWTDGTNNYTSTLPAVTGDATYTAVYTEEQMAWAYVSSSSETTFCESLVSAYELSTTDAGQGTIKLLRDYTIDAETEYMTVNHVIASPSKNVVLDLNGFTLTNPTNRNLFYLEENNYSLTITSTNGQGKYVHTNEAAPGAGTTKRCLVAIGNSGASAAFVARSVSVSISNVDVEVKGGSAFASYYASPKISLSNGTFSSPDRAMISMQSNEYWTASTIAKPEIALKNIIFNGSAFGWMNHFTNGSKTAAENSSLSLKLSGTNTINFTSAAYATQHGFQFRKGGAYISAFDPKNGFIQNAGNTIVSLNGAATGGGIYTVVMETPGPTMQIPLGRAVYGGTLNVLTGVLTVTHKMTTLRDIDGWMFTNMGNYFFAQLADTAKQSCDFSSSGYKPLPDGEFIGDIKYAVKISGEWVDINDPDYVEDDGEEIVGDVSGWLKDRAGNYQLVYELAQPETVQLTPQEVRTVLGANTFAADTGEVTVTLRVDPTLALAELRAAILGSAEA